jgi:hypothetical protein
MHRPVNVMFIAAAARLLWTPRSFFRHIPWMK